KAQASSDIVERLVDWNLDLTIADAEERQRLFSENESALRKEIKDAKLSPDDEAWAEKFLETGRALANNTDPVVEADLLNDLRDDLIVKVEAASKKGNEADSRRYANCYQKVMERAV